MMISNYGHVRLLGTSICQDWPERRDPGYGLRAGDYARAAGLLRRAQGATSAHQVTFAGEQAVERGAADAQLARGAQFVAVIQVENELDVTPNGRIE